MSAGCHEMLRRFPSARLVTGLLAHVLELPDWRVPARAARGPVHPRDDLDEESRWCWRRCRDPEPRGRMQLAAKAGLSLRTSSAGSPAGDDGLVIRRDGGFGLAPAPKETR